MRGCVQHMNPSVLEASLEQFFQFQQKIKAVAPRSKLSSTSTLDDLSDLSSECGESWSSTGPLSFAGFLAPPPGLEPPGLELPTKSASTPTTMVHSLSSVVHSISRGSPFCPVPLGLQDTMPCRVTSAMQPVKEAKAPLAPDGSRMSRRRAARKWDFVIFFMGYDPDLHKEFELVPRVIGRGGCNMTPIWTTGAKARVRGRGSGQDDSDDAMLQLAISCPSKEVMEMAYARVTELIDPIAQHFHRFCRKQKIGCPKLYTVQWSGNSGNKA